MVLLYYEILLFMSVGLTLIYAFMWHKHFDVHFTLVFAFIPISILGIVLCTRAETLEAAITANKMTYIGGCFLILFIMQSVFGLCSIKMPRLLKVLFLAISSTLLGLVAFFDHPLFYKSVTLDRSKGYTRLVKNYAFMHSVFYAVIVIYFVITIAGLAYSYAKKRSVSRTILKLLILPEIVCVICFFGGRAITTKVELIPLGYVFAQIMYLIIVHRICLYDMDDTVVDSLVMKGDTGFISFDFKFNYLGSNDTARGVFPELSQLTVDKPASRSEVMRETALQWLRAFRNDETADKAYYTKHDRIYLITVRYLYDGKHKRGYQLVITDDTKNQQYISLLGRYNDDLRREVAEKTEHIVEMHDNLILSMATMVESRDNSTGGHIRRTSVGVKMLIDEIRRDDTFELSDEFCRDIIKAAPMHDLGKIAVDDKILRKKGRFEPWEFEEMKKHAAEGARIVHEILKGTDDESFRVIAENVAHYHHERWDGSGYPEGLKGEEIPLEARIMAVADVYDALVSKRVYKVKMSFEEADKIIMEGMGKHFDKQLEPYYIAARPHLEEYYAAID